MENPVIPFDLWRMLFGDAPPGFLAEIVVRVLVVYAWTLLLVRWVGGRTVAQLSLVEFLLVIALGSAVGDPLFYPDVPLLHAMLAILGVVLINKGLDAVILRVSGAKRVLDGVPAEVVRCGRIIHAGIVARNMGPAELKAMLRTRGTSNLGQVRVAYLEADGKLSVFHHDKPRPGLAIVPPEEIEPPVLLDPNETEGLCCVSCGSGEREPGTTICLHCGGERWTPLQMPSLRSGWEQIA